MKELIQHVSCLCNPEELEEVLKSHYAEIYIPLASGGYLKHVKLSGGRHARVKVDKLPAQVEAAAYPVKVEEDLNFLPAGKIPYEFLEQIVEFFRQVSKKMKSDFEAHAWILWTKELGYFISVPKQSVSKASVHFTYDDDSLPPGSVIVCDIHSHNTMGAFYSGTDNNNDKSGIYYSAVVGKLTDTAYEYVIRFNLYEDKRACKLEEVFNIPQKEAVVVPTEWLAQVEEKTFTPHSNVSRLPSPSPRGSLWDNLHNPSGTLPFGFEELSREDIKDPKGRRGGNKDTKGKGEPDLTKWPYTQNGSIDLGDDDDIIVPGPGDFERMGLGIDVDSSELVIEIAGKYGKEAAESYGLIDDFLVNLEGCDEGLLDVITQCYALLTSSGQHKLNTEGIN